MKYLKSELKEVELSYNSTGIKRSKIGGSHHAAEILKALHPVDLEHREAFTILLLNRANNTIGFFTVSLGGVAGTCADLKLMFQAAIKCNASAMILCHNHPSGSLQASESDKQLTKKVIEAGKLLDISVLDHVILTAGSYFSFADESLM